MSLKKQLSAVPFTQVTIGGPFWTPRVTVNRVATLPIEYTQLKDTGRIDAFRLQWQPGDPNPPHIFWDSDVGKWIEAAAYSLATHPDAELEALVDGVIDLIAAAQQPDGYLNVHFTVVEPEKRWTNLRDWHELYCAGHLTEAAVAYYQATGKDQLLNTLRRYVDYIGTVFGRGEGQKRGYPGHEELELALVKLYRVTGEQRYLDLASYFIDERGQQPHYYDQEALARGDDPAKWHLGRYDYSQCHLPVRQQTTAEGHSVRAMYLYTGMADVAAETGDETLLEALETLWRNVTARRMYITGGIGSASSGERFSYDYDLPNDVAYAETCAAIGLVFWAQRMVQLTGEARYADTMERALYNGTISGVSLDGERFFYANPLEANPAAYAGRPDLFHPPLVYQRQGWFNCACCPPNIARLLASLGEYVYAQSDDAAYVHLYIAGRADLQVAGQPVGLTQETNYPWAGEVKITVQPERAARWTLALRLPGWCRGAQVTVNGQAVEPVPAKGYLRVERVWQAGDVVELSLPMPIERVEAHPAVRADAGRVALQRGPVVYCLEEADNGGELNDLVLPRDAELTAAWEPDLLGGVMTIRGTALRREPAGWDTALYRPAPSPRQAVPIIAIPYYTWANRTPGEMLVWIPQGE